jgi:hypothetical protein
MKTLIVASFFSLLISISAFAQERTPRVNGRQKAQRVRIAEGHQSGEVTNGEAAALNKQQRHIRRSERRAKADGNVTAVERMRLDRKQDRANRNIRRAKTNNLDKN